MENLLVAVQGCMQSRLVEEVFDLVAQSRCHIIYGHVYTTAKHVTIVLLVSGAWNAIAKFETVVGKKHSGVLLIRSELRANHAGCLPYTSYIVIPDAPEALAKLIRFLSEQQVMLYDLNVESYKAPITGAAMLSVSLSLGICHTVADFRERFIYFCDDNNFDAAMEPHK